MTPLRQVLAAVLAFGVPMSSSLKLEPLHHGNESTVSLHHGNESTVWKDLMADDDDNDDTPKVVVDNAPPKVVVDAKPPGPMNDDVEIKAAPPWGVTEVMAPWAPAELALALQFQQWPGSDNLRTTFKGYMEDDPENIRRLAEKYAMPEVQVIALIAYSIYDYHTINKVLRGRLEGYSPEEIHMAGVIGQLVLKGLEKLPSIGTKLLFRGTTLPAWYFDTLEKENYLYEPAFLSTSTRTKVAADFADRRASVILQIICPPPGAPVPQCRGKDLKEFSEFPDEDEIVFPPGTKFAKVGEGEIFINPERSQPHRLFVLQPWL